MKISSIQNNYTQQAKNNKLSFEGTWRQKKVYSPSGIALYTQKIYTPDQNETLHSVAKAWKEETGLYPIDWIKTKNPYNQTNTYYQNNDHRNVEYRLNGYPYIPISLLKASVHEKISDNKKFDIERLNGYLELASLSAQENDPTIMREYENDAVYEYLNAPTQTIKRSFVTAMNNYKDHWGSAIWALDIKNAPEKHFYQDATKMANDYREMLEK